MALFLGTNAMTAAPDADRDPERLMEALWEHQSGGFLATSDIDNAMATK